MLIVDSIILLYHNLVDRLVHAFTCAGILPSQYVHFSQFSGLGVVGKWFINQGDCREEGGGGGEITIKY